MWKIALPLLLTHLAQAAEPASPLPQPPAAAARVNLLTKLTGTWQFRLGKRSGTRTGASVYGDLAFRFDEEFDEGGLLATGLCVYDPASDEHLCMDAHNVESAVGMLRGRADRENTRIVFEPLRLGKDEAPYRLVLTFVDDDHFHYVAQRPDEKGAWKDVWRADYSRRR